MMKEEHRKNYLFLTVLAVFCLGIAIMLNLLTPISLGQSAIFIAVAGCLIAIASFEYTRYLIEEKRKQRGDKQ